MHIFLNLKTGVVNLACWDLLACQGSYVTPITIYGNFYHLLFVLQIRHFMQTGMWKRTTFSSRRFVSFEGINENLEQIFIKFLKC